MSQNYFRSLEIKEGSTLLAVALLACKFEPLAPDDANFFAEITLNMFGRKTFFKRLIMKILQH